MSTLPKFGGSTKCKQVYDALVSVDGSLVSTLKDTTTVVTGANTGIGMKTAQQLSYLGGTVVLACRSEKKATKAIKMIRESKECNKYGLKGEELKLEFVQVDLGSIESCNNFSKALVDKVLNNEIPKIRLLVFNAGILPTSPNAKSVDGLSIAFAVNHLGHFAVWRKLHKLALEADSSSIFHENQVRVVNVSSVSHFGPLTTKEVSNEEEMKKMVAGLKTSDPKPVKLKSMGAYGNSKLCNVHFAQSLSELSSEDSLKITACSLHPGTLITTDIGRNSLVISIFMKAISMFTKSVDQGSSTTYLCSLLPDADLEVGGYYTDCKVKEPSRRVRGEEGKAARDLLWKISEEICEAFENGNLSELLPSNSKL